MSETVRAHVFISGRVQRVFYRAGTREAARRQDVDGWVKNRPEGGIEAVFEGPSDAVDAMVEWCHTGSDRAAVEDVSVSWEEPVGLESFEIRR